MSKPSIKLHEELYRRAAKIAEKAGYSSVDEFVEHMVEKELAQLEDSDSKEDVIRKLKGLGYLK